jgi:hypothetical protein
MKQADKYNVVLILFVYKHAKSTISVSSNMLKHSYTLFVMQDSIFGVSFCFVHFVFLVVYFAFKKYLGCLFLSSSFLFNTYEK